MVALPADLLGIGLLGICLLLFVFLPGWFFIDSIKRSKAREKARWEFLVKRFGPEIATRILQKQPQIGDSSEIILEMMGKPVDIEVEVLKTKTKEILKYHPTGRNQYALRVIVENGSVVGWKIR